MSRLRRHRENPQEDGESPLWGLVRLVLGGVLFVFLWAGMNFVFGTALDGPVGVFLMETPCQRLAQRMRRPPGPLDRYELGKATGGSRRGGGGRLTPSVCHFASGPIRVGDGPTEGLGFSGREFVYLAIGFAGYAVCFAGALALAFFIVRTGWRLIARKRPTGV